MLRLGRREYALPLDCVVEVGGRAFDLVADGVTDVRPLAAPVERLEVVPEASLVAGVTHVDGRLVSLLDPGRLASAVPSLPAGTLGRVRMDG